MFKGKFGAEDGELEPVAKLMSEKFDVSFHVARRKWYYGFALKGTNVDDEATLGVQYRIVGRAHVNSDLQWAKIEADDGLEIYGISVRTTHDEETLQDKCIIDKGYTALAFDDVQDFLIRCIQIAPPASLARAVLTRKMKDELGAEVSVPASAENREDFQEVQDHDCWIFSEG